VSRAHEVYEIGKDGKTVAADLEQLKLHDDDLGGIQDLERRAEDLELVTFDIELDETPIRRMNAVAEQPVERCGRVPLRIGLRGRVTGDERARAATIASANHHHGIGSLGGERDLVHVETWGPKTFECRMTRRLRFDDVILARIEDARRGIGPHADVGADVDNDSRGESGVTKQSQRVLHRVESICRPAMYGPAKAPRESLGELLHSFPSVPVPARCADYTVLHICQSSREHLTSGHADITCVSVPQRYASLDAWRGFAAMSVVIFHCGNTIVGPESGAGRILHSGWLGVFIFFPISGYCILAALQSPANRTFGAFLTRRWRRIMPPYWASIAVAVAVGFAALPFNRGSAADLLLPHHLWPAVLTLTQVFTDQSNVINPVYWSLCYEEQFYFVMAVMLAAPASRRGVLLAVLTAIAAVYVSPAWPWRVRGLFLEYWMCFATGCAAYLWLHEKSARMWAAAILTIAGGIGVLTANIALLMSVGVAIALVALAPYDSVLARTRSVAALMAVGTFSFSLYLVHVPIGGRVTNLLTRVAWPPYVIVPVSCAVSLGAAWLFYLMVERRTLRARPLLMKDSPDQVAVAA
jgi:peptidoglycan/LPS O-acetylase OafA/YrhL